MSWTVKIIDEKTGVEICGPVNRKQYEAIILTMMGEIKKDNGETEVLCNEKGCTLRTGDGYCLYPKEAYSCNNYIPMIEDWPGVVDKVLGSISEVDDEQDI